MPAQRPRAQFQSIPTDFDLSAFVDSYDHFDFCSRIAYADIQHHGMDSFERLVRKHVIAEGKPLVIEGFQDVLDPWTFSAKWLKDNVGDKIEVARDLNTKDNIPLTIRHYLNSINAVTNQHYRKRESEKDRAPQRIYLKDIDCPEVWQQKLAEVIPQCIYYLNESTGDYGGPGASVVQNPTVAGRRLGRGIAPAGDLMSSLPPQMRAENLMCYIGHEGTYTPAHREMCATMGHNIMVEASGDVAEDGKPEKPGSSIWFMTEAKDRHSVAEFWLSKLGHDIEVETHFAQINSWKLAPFKVWIVDQRPGDFILIPPLAPHQVWNRGTRTMKVAWNRTTVETLEKAFSEALPKARIVCRDEQYKNKAIVYYTLHKYSDLLTNAKSQADNLPPENAHALLHKGKIRQLQRSFRRLLGMYKDILLTEMLPTEFSADKFEFLPFDSNVTCGYCRGNIFNRFLSCQSCKDDLGGENEEPYDVCMECYAMGRSCYCISGQKWVEQFKWKDLVSKYDSWRQQIIDLGGVSDPSMPLALAEERQRRTKKTLAEVVRDELRKRPFVDPRKPKKAPEPVEEDVIVDDEGRVKKTVKKHSKTYLKNNSLCHVCKYRHENWKMAQCTRCDKWWCYGSVFRGHDDMPIDIMENLDWECVHCQGTCFAGSCRLDPRQVPYVPKGTLLGHDTKKIADIRSVEALVDFSVSNLNWIREDEHAEETAQMRRARAEGEKARNAGHEDDDDDEHPHIPTAVMIAPMLPDPSQQDIDPELRADAHLAQQLTQYNQSDATANHHHGLTPQGLATAENTTYPDYDIFPHDEGDNGYMYPSPNLPGRSPPPPEVLDPAFGPFVRPDQSPNFGKKRGRASDGDELIRMEPAKKPRRVTDHGSETPTSASTTTKPLNEATKQYQMLKERQALDEAKRNNRFFAVFAALRGKSKKVVLKIATDKLAAIVARSTVSNAAPVDTTRPEDGASRIAKDGSISPDLLTSDVQTKSTASHKPLIESNKTPVKNNKSTQKKGGRGSSTTNGARNSRRSRASTKHTHDDDDDDQDGDMSSQNPSKRRRPDEDVDDDDDDEDNFFTPQGSPAQPQHQQSSRNRRRASDGTRRVPAYLEARQEHDNSVVVLPKEKLKPNTDKRKSLPTKLDAAGGARPRGRPKRDGPRSAHSTRLVRQGVADQHAREEEDGEQEDSIDHGTTSRRREDGEMSANGKTTNGHVLSEAEQNRRAKMAAFESVQSLGVDDDDDAAGSDVGGKGDDDDFDNDVDEKRDETVVVERRSIFDKMGRGRAKVKIVSQAKMGGKG